MKFLQSIWSDLVEKRLWPIAVALVIALIAIPVLLGGKSTPTGQVVAGAVVTPTPTGQGSLGPTALSSPQVKLLQATAHHGKTGVRDPFKQPKIPVVKTKSAQSGPGPAPESAAQTNVSTTPPVIPYTPPATSTPPSSGSGSDSGGSHKADTSLYRVTLRVGQSGDLKTHTAVERLSPLPSVTDPFFVFMGVMSDGKTAVFLLSSDAKATGDGVCKPSPDNCQTVEMKADDIEFFDVASADPTAPPTQYELDVNKIVKSSAPTGAVAARANTPLARSGRAVVAETRAAGASQLADYAYSPHDGTLQRRLPTLSDVLANIARSSAP